MEWGNRKIGLQRAVNGSQALNCANLHRHFLCAAFLLGYATRMSKIRISAAIILAAGEGSRMKSAIPKPLHAVGGRSLLAHTIEAAKSVQPDGIALVVGAGGEAVSAAALREAPGAVLVEQKERLGTAHAVLAAKDVLASADGDAVVLYADTPFIQPETLSAMQNARAAGADIVVLGFRAAHPGGYGRLVMAGDALHEIVEAKEATPEQLAITLCNSGVMMADASHMLDWLGAVGCDNANGEYYLTDIVAIARAKGMKAAVVECDEVETLGVNSRADLAGAEAAFQDRARQKAMAAGTTLIAPDSVWFSYDTELGRDVIIEPNVIFAPGVKIADGATIRGHSHLEGCSVASGAVIGPFARLRPGADIGEGARIGNFVEVKNAHFGIGAKANHLAYVGDAQIGSGANIGAGVITANYDGVFKYPTNVGRGAFVGSNSTLIAPSDIGDGAFVAGGSVITGTVEEGALVVARAKAEEKPGIGARMRTRLSEMKAAGQKKKGAI